MIIDKQQLGNMVVDITMELDNTSVEKTQKQMLTYVQKMMKRVNNEIKSGLKRGLTTAVGGILGGDAGMLVGAVMGGGTGAALGVAVGYVIDYAVKKVMAKYKSEDFFKNIDPYVKQDYSKILDVKSNLPEVDTKEAFIISELSKIFKTDPATLSKQIAISQKYKGFANLEGGTSAEKMSNFLVSISGMSQANQVRIAGRYGITSSNIPSLEKGMGGLESTLLSGFNKEQLDRYIRYLEKYSELEKKYLEFEKEMAIKARQGLNHYTLNDGIYNKLFGKAKKTLEKGINSGLSQQYGMMDFATSWASIEALKQRELEQNQKILDCLNSINSKITSNPYKIEKGKKDDVIKIKTDEGSVARIWN